MNSVLPGAIVTEAIETMAARRGVTMEEQNAKLAEFHAMKRVGQADEVRHPKQPCRHSTVSLCVSATCAWPWGQNAKRACELRQCMRAQAVLPACVVISLC